MELKERRKFVGNFDKQRKRRRRLRLVSGCEEYTHMRIFWIMGTTAATIISWMAFRNRLIAAGIAFGAALVAYLRMRPPVAVQPPAPVNKPEEESPAEYASQLEGYIFIDAPLSAVYQNARRLSYFKDALPEVTDVEAEHSQDARLDVFDGAKHWHVDLAVVADEKDDFFAFRVEHEETMFGTCLIRFETTPGATGTIVRITCRYKAPAQALDKAKFVPLLDREIKTYLQSLKAGCEIVRTVSSP